MRILLPIGISFYTFAGISYAMDVYRGHDQARPRAYVHYLAWVTLFPHLVAGPIVRYGHVGAQLERAQQRFRWALVGTGLFFLVMGLAKKMLVADLLAPYVNDLFSHHAHLGLLSGWAAALGYTLQLYFDFSGYSRHGGRRRAHDRPPLPAELRLAVQGGQPLGLLAPLAHDPLRLAARLPVHPARRLARQPRCSPCATC